MKNNIRKPQAKIVIAIITLLFLGLSCPWKKEPTPTEPEANFAQLKKDFRVAVRFYFQESESESYKDMFLELETLPNLDVSITFTGPCLDDPYPFTGTTDAEGKLKMRRRAECRGTYKAEGRITYQGKLLGIFTEEIDVP